jgi:hypothetical protein
MSRIARTAILVAFAAIGVSASGKEMTAHFVDRRDAAVAKALAAPTTVTVRNMPLEDLVNMLAKQQRIPMRLDANGLRRADVAPSRRITASFQEVPLGVVLRSVLRPHRLQHRISDGVVLIDDIGIPLDDVRPQRPREPAVGIAAQPVNQLNLLIANPVFQPAVVNGQVARAANMQRLVANAPTVTQHLQLIMQVELKFLNRVCAPAPEQRRQFEQGGAKQIDELAKAWQLDRRGARALSDLRRAVEDKLVDLVRSKLSPAQAARYEVEIKKRTANLRQVSARNLVVALDQELFLTESQRRKLCEELAANWDDAWTMTVVFGSTAGSGFIPNIPDELIVPYLDADQRSLWNTLPKRGNTIWSPRTTSFLGMTPPELEKQK